MQRTLLMIFVLSLMLVPALAQDDETEFPDIIGETVPKTEQLLNDNNYTLHPVILSTDIGDGELNTVINFEIIDDGTVVQVTVLREYNVRLIWDNANADFLRNLPTDSVFTFINLSGEDMYLRNIQIGDFDITRWQTSLRANQCAQIWATNERSPLGLDECDTIQGGNVANMTNQQFWRQGDGFDIYQNGIYRATCPIDAGSCDIWLSPLSIAEDIAPYSYFIYNDNELLVYNNSETQWMNLSQLSINNFPELSNVRNWTWTSPLHTNLDTLAPHQCLRFTINQEDEPLESCTPIAIFNAEANEIFWTSAFSLVDNLNGRKTYTCPPSQGMRTICLLSR